MIATFVTPEELLVDITNDASQDFERVGSFAGYGMPLAGPRDDGVADRRDDLGGIVRNEIRRMFGQRPFAGGGTARAAETPDTGHTVEREPEGRTEEAEADDRDVFHGFRISRFHTG